MSHKNTTEDTDITNVVPSTECTGLIPNLPEDEDGKQAYSEICNVPHKKSNNKK